MPTKRTRRSGARIGPSIGPRDHASRARRITQLHFQLAPPSNENDCSQRAESRVISDQSKRTRSGIPLQHVLALEAGAAGRGEAALDGRVQAAGTAGGRPPDAPEVVLGVVEAQREPLVAGGAEVVDVARAAEHRPGL